MAGYLVWALYATYARDQFKKEEFNSICKKIECYSDEPYKFNKYIYDNLQYRKHTNFGHAKLIFRGMSFFQITSFFKLEYLPEHYRYALIVIGLLSTLLYLSLYFLDVRSEMLKAALQFSQERKWLYKARNMDTHCCQSMKKAVSSPHEGADCHASPDCLIDYNCKFDEYGIVIHDGGSSVLTIEFCPWCGSKLPESRRDEWFEELERIGITDPQDKTIPAKYLSNEWYESDSTEK